MHLLTKHEDKLLVIASRDESVRIGDVLEADGVISQVVDIGFPDLPGIQEHILRQSLIPKTNTKENTEEEIRTMFGSIADSRIVVSKIRGHISSSDGKDIFKPGLTDFNISRETTKPIVLPPKKLVQLLNLNFGKNTIATTISSEDPIGFDFLPNHFGISLITGQKGYGKSYFSKRLLLNLIESGALVIVFDINGEYGDLDKDENLKPNDYSQHFTFLERSRRQPQGNRLPFRIPLNQISSFEFCKAVNIFENQATFATLIRFWNEHAGQQFDLNDVRDFANGLNDHREQAVRETIIDRVRTAETMNLFGPMDWTQILQSHQEGGAVVISLAREHSYLLSIMVRFILRSIERWVIERQRGIALFLEEAQNYVEGDDSFRDLLTRMRHIGGYPVFITNDPQTLPPEVLSLADNVVCFKFESEQVLSHISKSGKIDEGTLKNLKILESGQCLCVGKFTNDFPFFLQIGKQDGVKMAGETKPLV